MSQNHQLLFLKGYFLILDRASHRASLKFSSAVCDGALWKGLGAAFVPPEGKHRTLMPETFVCTYLSPCIAWSSLLSAITPTDIFYITNAFPGHVFNMCCSWWWWDLTDGVMRHGKEWLVQHHQQVQQCWWLSSYFLNPPMGLSWMGAGFWSSFCCALFCSVINPPHICAAPGFVSKLCTHLLILHKCSEAMFRNQLRFILLALCRWKHLLVIQHDYVCFSLVYGQTCISQARAGWPGERCMHLCMQGIGLVFVWSTECFGNKLDGLRVILSETQLVKAACCALQLVYTWREKADTSKSFLEESASFSICVC